MSVVEPFLKWVGSKRQLAPEILSRLPERIDHYVEPFLGGGAIFFALVADGRFGPNAHIILADLNEDLINCWRQVRDHPEAVANALPRLPISEDAYYRMRSAQLTSPIARAIRFIYLNKCGFNGMYRVNRKGVFNIPWNKNPTPGFPSKAQLCAVSHALREHDVTLSCQPYGETLAHPEGGMVAYLDPPFAPVSDTANFTAYTKEGFDAEAQEHLAELCVNVGKAGGLALLSNASVPQVHELYARVGFAYVDVVEARRSINSDGTKRGKVGEVLAGTARV